MFYCFDVVVSLAGASHDTKYFFQEDVAMAFNYFITTLAFAAPLDAVDGSVIACHVKKKLPNPRDVALPISGCGRRQRKGDENASE